MQAEYNIASIAAGEVTETTGRGTRQDHRQESQEKLRGVEDTK